MTSTTSPDPKRLKILVVSSFMPPHLGGLELVAAGLVDGLRDRGHHVRWMASADPLPAKKEGDLLRVSAFNGFENWASVPLPIWGPSALRVLHKECRWADVVQVHDCIYPTTWAAVTAAKAHHKPILITQHIAEVPYPSRLKVGLQRAVYRSWGRTILQHCDVRVTSSLAVRDYFEGLGVTGGFEIIIPGFSDRFRPESSEQRAAFRDEFRVPRDFRVALFVGRLVEKKGVALVAQVQERLGKQGVHLVVAGDGPERPLIASLPQTTHLRQLPYSDMHKVYAMSDLLLLPSYGEGLPLTVQEAMLTGLPVVVSRDPSYLSNLAEAPHVHMCGSVEELVQAINHVLSDEVDPSYIASWARSAWGRGKFIDGYERAFRTLVSGREQSC